MIIIDWYVFIHCIFNFPFRRFHLIKRTPYSHLYIISSKSYRGSTAVHSCISSSENNNFLTYRFCMFKGNASKPINSNVYTFFSFFSSFYIDISPFRSSGSDKYCIKVFIKKLFHTRYLCVEASFYTKINYLIYFFIKDFFRQSKRGDICSHKTTSSFISFK